MFRRIVVPLDGSALAEQALGQAAAIARASGAAIDLVLVHAPFSLQTLETVPWGGSQWDAAERYLETLAKELRTGAGILASHAQRKGEPVHLICERASDVDADLIVMTSHGRTGLSRAWFGSVADGVMRHAQVPVLILRPLAGKTNRAAAHRLFKQVLVPFDGFSTEVLPSAIALAQCGGAQMTLLRVVQPIPQLMLDAGLPYAATGAIADGPATKLIADAAREQLDEMALRLHDETGLVVTSRVIIDPSVATSIVEFARTDDTDIIAMASHSGPISRLFLGSVADKVVRASNAPVLLYNPARVGELPTHESETADTTIGEFVVI